MSRRKGRHLIVGLSDERLSITVAAVSSRGFHVVSHALEDLPADAAGLHRRVVTALMDARPRPESVHLLIAHRTTARFTLDLPKLKRGELETVVARRARAEANLAIDAPIEVAHLPAGKGEGGLTRYEVAGFPAAALEYVRPVLDDSLIHVETVTLREHAALNALPSELPNHSVLLDENRGGIRIAYLTGGALTLERNVMLALEEGAARERLISKLKFELARTLDYFASQEAPPPEALVFTPALGLSVDEQQDVARDLPRFGLDLPTGEDGETSIDLPVLGLLRALSGTGALPVLDRGRPPRPKGTLVAVVLVLATAVGGIVAARAAATYARDAAQRAEEHAPRLAELERELAALEGQLVPIEDVDPEEERLKSVLGRRRPASRLLADVMRAVPEGVVLKDVGYDERGRIYVRGELDAGDRLTAIRLLGALREALEGAPYMRDVTERVIYAEGGAAAGAPMRFELRAEWEV